MYNKITKIYFSFLQWVLHLLGNCSTTKLTSVWNCILSFIYGCILRQDLQVQAGLKLTYVTLPGLELRAVFLPQPPECWGYRHVALYPAESIFLTSI